jgi:hypothetical protein
MAAKIISFSSNGRAGKMKPSERFRAQEIYRPREDRTQKRFVPEAMNLSLVTTSHWAEKLSRLQSKGGGRIPQRSPSTLRWNNHNVNRKAAARGRTK